MVYSAQFLRNTSFRVTQSVLKSVHKSWEPVYMERLLDIIFVIVGRAEEKNLTCSSL